MTCGLYIIGAVATLTVIIAWRVSQSGQITFADLVFGAVGTAIWPVTLPAMMFCLVFIYGEKWTIWRRK